jgi:hypothetical protein
LKKLILILVSAFVGISSRGQGTLWLNNYDSGFGIFEYNLPAPVGTQIQVLVGASPGSLSPIESVGPNPSSIFTVGASDVNGKGPGTGSFFDGGYGHVIDVAPGATAYVEVIAWVGAPSFSAALVTSGAYIDVSPVFSEALGTSPSAPNIPVPAILELPGSLRFFYVPEPSGMAVSVLGAAILLAFRRRK